MSRETDNDRFSLVLLGPWQVRYGGAFLSVTAAIVLWSLFTRMHQDPFAIFVLGVVFTARFLGFGPAVFCVLHSPWSRSTTSPSSPFSLAIQKPDMARLVIFVIISLLAASLARRSREPRCPDQTLSGWGRRVVK
jgi:hypothetical protein